MGGAAEDVCEVICVADLVVEGVDVVAEGGVGVADVPLNDSCAVGKLGSARGGADEIPLAVSTNGNGGKGTIAEGV